MRSEEVLSVPDIERPTMESIDAYMNRLHSVLLSPAGNPQLLSRVASIVERLDLQG